MRRVLSENDDDISNPPRKRRAIRNDDEDLFKFHHPGFIRSVECINFMCHKNLKVNLGPGITFVSGRNGHGKSAILTALIQVFSTSRAMRGERGTISALRRNVQGNIKAKSAKIIVHINNKEATADMELSGVEHRGYTMSPYEPETFGDCIVIEKEIFEKVTKIRIMAADRTVISEKQGSLLNIMRHFSYQFDNRLVIQTQENAKKRGDPHVLFDFFYNGSGFESIENDLAMMKTEITKQVECIEALLAPSMDAKKAQRDKLKAEHELTEHTKHMYDDLHRYKAMYKWLEYRTVQESIDTTLRSILKYEDRLNHLKDVEGKREKQLDEQKKILESCKAGDPELETKFNQVRQALGSLTAERNDNEILIRTSEKDAKAIEEQIARLEGGIERLRSERDKNHSNEEKERLTTQVLDLEKAVSATKSAVEACKEKVDTSRNLSNEATSKAEEISRSLRMKTEQLRDLQNETLRLESMSKEKGNPIAPFGPQFPKT